MDQEQDPPKPAQPPAPPSGKAKLTPEAQKRAGDHLLKAEALWRYVKGSRNAGTKPAGLPRGFHGLYAVLDLVAKICRPPRSRGNSMPSTTKTAISLASQDLGGQTFGSSRVIGIDLVAWLNICGACQELAPYLDALVLSDGDVANVPRSTARGAKAHTPAMTKEKQLEVASTSFLRPLRAAVERGAHDEPIVLPPLPTATAKSPTMFKPIAAFKPIATPLKEALRAAVEMDRLDVVDALTKVARLLGDA